MLSILEILLSPIIWVMQRLMYWLWSLTGSEGAAVILLSVLVAFFSLPLRNWAAKIEGNVRKKKKDIDKEVTTQAAGLAGEERFRIIETIYEKNSFHPIQGVALGLSFIVMLPFLLAALFLLANEPGLIGKPYFSIDARLRFGEDLAMIFRFGLIALVLFFLVYNLSSALVLYWTVSNVTSAITYQIKAARETRKAERSDCQP